MIDRAFTVDVEDWHHSNLAGMPATAGATSILPQSMPLLLDLLAELNVRASFFILADVLDEVKPFLPRLRAAGHEVASHGSHHRLAYEQTADEFRADIAAAKRRIEDAWGEAIAGYRAPSWSIGPANKHYLQAIADAGYHYDASLLPFRTYLYGYPDAPRAPFQPRIDGRLLPLVEVPGTTARLWGKVIPFAGGFYLRALPAALLKRLAANAAAEGLPLIYYLHPREILVEQPRPAGLTARERLIHLHGLRGVAGKLRTILQSGGFRPLGELVATWREAGLPAGDL